MSLRAMKLCGGANPAISIRQSASRTVPTRHIVFSSASCSQASSGQKSMPQDRANEDGNTENASSRRGFVTGIVGAALLAVPARPLPSFADDDTPVICDEACVSRLAEVEKVTTPSGLQFQDVVAGTGASPPVGYQVVVNYVAMTPDGRIFANSLERGSPYDIRVGSGQVIDGLDEGLKTMRVGGIRRLYIPGNLAFPKGLSAGPGRPRVPPSSPVVFDVQLLLVPGLDSDE